MLYSKISRRKFIPIAIGGIIALGAVAYGYNELLKKPAAPTSTPTPEIPSETAPSPTTIPKKFNLELTLFHDYHGDGIKQDDEPVIIDAALDLYEVRENGGSSILLEGIKGTRNGIYRLEDLIDGRGYEIIFSKDTFEKYRYLSISNKEFRESSNYRFVVSSSMPEISLGLMEGFLTLPVRDGTDWEFKETSFYDHGGPPFIKDGTIRDWKGGGQTYDGHAGTDFYMSNGQLVIASAPGTVILAEDAWHTSYFKLNNYHKKHGNRVMIYHDNGMKTYYCHLDDGLFVKPAERVDRGQLIAFSDRSGTLVKGQPHLHFGVYIGSADIEWGLNADPYRDVEDPDLESLWTKDNDPQYSIREG